MKRQLSTVLTLALILAAALTLYLVKYRVQVLHEDIAKLEDQLKEERELLRVAKAEWAYVNQPERLKVLAEKHLHMKPASGAQFAVFEALPYRQVTTADAKPTGSPTPAALNRTVSAR